MTKYSAKIYPNGEFSVHRPKRFRPDGVRQAEYTDQSEALAELIALNKALGGPGQAAVLDRIDELRQDADLGLSIPTNFDEPVEKRRYGLNGITPKARRKVRNGAFVLQSDVGKEHLSFLTLTVPELPVKDMQKLHEEWSKIVDSIKRKLTRALQESGLPGEVVMVVEIQQKRYERTGIPVLHIHAVFQGRKRRSSWAITTSMVDEMWASSMDLVLGYKPSVVSACNIQKVKKSCEGYLGKYMTKGVEDVKKLTEEGYEKWLPKQWWSMSRSLGKKIEKRTKVLRQEARTVWNLCLDEDDAVFAYVRPVVLENKMGVPYIAAFFGRLNPDYINAFR